MGANTHSGRLDEACGVLVNADRRQVLVGLMEQPLVDASKLSGVPWEIDALDEKRLRKHHVHLRNWPTPATSSGIGRRTSRRGVLASTRSGPCSRRWWSTDPNWSLNRRDDARVDPSTPPVCVTTRDSPSLPGSTDSEERTVLKRRSVLRNRHAPSWLGRNGARRRIVPAVDASMLCDYPSEQFSWSETAPKWPVEAPDPETSLFPCSLPIARVRSTGRVVGP